MSNWLKRVFARVTGRSTEEKAQESGLGRSFDAANTNRKSTGGSSTRSVAKRRTASSPGYGSTSRRTSDDTYIHTSPIWYSSGDSGSSGSYDSGGSCDSGGGGGDGGGGGGCD
ncbi:MAG TPA: hypothetical protein PLW48_10195 [Alphaproteobacteria bacterium]|nr:hypothetical protein [Rhodospirillaceae bacterium]HRJ67496.1 hypothetical protein [Alphaproteobacteria bacterium]